MNCGATFWTSVRRESNPHPVVGETPYAAVTPQTPAAE
jgi:hypothetical protein